MTQTLPEELEKRFNDRFLWMLPITMGDDLYNNFKDFLSQELSSALQAERQALRGRIEKMKKVGESVPISCPDGIPGCLVMHWSSDRFITPEIRLYNQALEDLLAIVEDGHD